MARWGADNERPAQWLRSTAVPDVAEALAIAEARGAAGKAELLAALERARPYVMIEAHRPTILPVVPAIEALAMIDAAIAAAKEQK